MSERQSIVIEEYLLMLYHLRDAGEDLKSLPQFMQLYKECKEMGW